MLTLSTLQPATAARRVQTIELVEDDPSVQRALSMVLREQGYVVQAYATRAAYLAAPRSSGPRVVLLDMRLPDSNGLAISEVLKQQQDDAPVIFISGQSAPQEIVDALKGGAFDFLLKPIRLPDLLRAIESAFGRAMDRQDEARRLGRLRERWSGLTRREREVCVLMLKGMANREIARVNGSAPGTVKVQRAKVLEKMGAHSLSELFRMAAGASLADWLASEEDDA